ncbi:hypothetical protein NST62_08475 [Ureibacillus sp. FSL K6-8385]|uniref:hypothetical protein n=1 Tax=Ureibacillus TaxID=160795 RepID=UPI0011462534|nr:hypothetical protein [Ureibacillus terrenus]MED3661986.1 hypothetical protein [Ureibacillus terrenus]MED3764751.1 hypothetical protein [Ureibacillus terrenus]
MMHVIRLSWLISLAISFFGFLIVNQLFNVQPKGATGNLGFIGVIFLFPFLCLSLLTTFRYFATAIGTVTSVGKIMGIFGGIVLIGILLYLFIDMKNSIKGPIFALNQETSRLYFDLYTFGLIHAISGVLGALYGIARPISLEQAKENNQNDVE